MMGCMNKPALLCLACYTLLAACQPQEVQEAVADNRASYPFWGITYGCGFEPLKEAAVLAEIRLDETLIRTSSARRGKAELEDTGEVLRCLRGTVAPGMRVTVKMLADSTPYSIVNECLETGRSCRYAVDHGGRKAYLYVPANREYTVSAERGVLYHAEVSYSPIFWGSEADDAVDSLFSPSIETK